MFAGTLDRCSSYTVMIVWEFAWADSALVILDKWSSYGSGCLSRFHSTQRNENLKKMINRNGN